MRQRFVHVDLEELCARVRRILESTELPGGPFNALQVAEALGHFRTRRYGEALKAIFHANVHIARFNPRYLMAFREVVAFGREKQDAALLNCVLSKCHLLASVHASTGEEIGREVFSAGVPLESRHIVAFIYFMVHAERDISHEIFSLGHIPEAADLEKALGGSTRTLARNYLQAFEAYTNARALEADMARARRSFTAAATPSGGL